MTIKTHITDLDEPIITKGCVPKQNTFYDMTFIQDPITERWYPTTSIKYVEVD